MVNKTRCILVSIKLGILLIFLHTKVLAQHKVTVVRNYSGKIGKYPIALQLEFINGTDSVFGSYYYLKSGRDALLFLAGKRDQAGMRLHEQDYSQRNAANKPIVTGVFELQGKTQLKGIWTNRKTGKGMVIELLSRQAGKDIHPKDYRFKFGSYRTKVLNAGGWEGNYTKIRSLEIYKGQKLDQRLSGFDECVGKGGPELVMEDLNFDGILDIKVPTYFPERTKYDGAFLYFLYNPAKQKFEMNQQMVDMEYLFFDPLHAEVYKYGEAAEGFVRQVFKWNAGKLVELRTELEKE